MNIPWTLSINLHFHLIHLKIKYTKSSLARVNEAVAKGEQHLALHPLRKKELEFYNLVGQAITYRVGHIFKSSLKKDLEKSKICSSRKHPHQNKKFKYVVERSYLY